MSIEGDRPKHRMYQDEHETAVTKSKPDQRKREQRYCRQRIEHRGDGFQKVGPDSRADGEDSQTCREHDARNVTHKMQVVKELPERHNRFHFN